MHKADHLADSNHQYQLVPDPIKLICSNEFVFHIIQKTDTPGKFHPLFFDAANFFGEIEGVITEVLVWSFVQKRPRTEMSSPEAPRRVARTSKLIFQR